MKAGLCRSVARKGRGKEKEMKAKPYMAVLIPVIKGGKKG